MKLSLHLAGVLLKTGEATDEDLQSLASMLSTNTLGPVSYNALKILHFTVKSLRYCCVTVT